MTVIILFKKMENSTHFLYTAINEESDPNSEETIYQTPNAQSSVDHLD